MPEIDLTATRGCVATVNLTGSIHTETAFALADARAWCMEHGFQQIEWRQFPAQLVEAGRDSVCHHALSEGYDWLIQVDGDAYPLPRDFVGRLLYSGFIQQPEADMVGAYAQLKGSNMPTIDRGSGTWEPVFPGEGLVPVIRTGGHCFMLKTSSLRRFGPPWFRTRRPIRPLDALAEIDGFARQRYSGRNPLADSSEWKEMLDAARQGAEADLGSVGEDSGFCDRLKAAGGQIYVDTNLVVGHIDKRIIQPGDLKERLEERDEQLGLAVGVY